MNALGRPGDGAVAVGPGAFAGPGQLLPWSLTDLRRLLAGLAGAAGALLMGWWGTAQNARVSHQLGWLIVALLGAMAAASCCAAFLVVGYRAIVVRRVDTLSTLLSAGDRPGPSFDAASERFVALPVMSYFHRADCPFTRGKPAGARTRARHLADGRRPCPGCRP